MSPSQPLVVSTISPKLVVQVSLGTQGQWGLGGEPWAGDTGAGHQGWFLLEPNGRPHSRFLGPRSFLLATL